MRSAWIALLMMLIMGGEGTVLAQTPTTKTFPSGSYIIKLGVYTGTNRAADVNTQLKPYGLIYDLLKNYNVPIYWVIGQSKVKDGADFTYNNVFYHGGTFLIDKDYITPAVAGRISSWSSPGVLGAYTTSSLSLNYFHKFSGVPTYTLDAQNGGIATGFFANAGIPVTAHNWLLDAQLELSAKLFVILNSDPKWRTIVDCYSLNQLQQGLI